MDLYICKENMEKFLGNSCSDENKRQIGKDLSFQTEHTTIWKKSVIRTYQKM